MALPGAGPALYETYKDDEAAAANAKGHAECVLLVQKLTGAPVTATWKRGAKVRGGAVTAGTAIATFQDNGTYDGNSGVCHAAIDLGATATGIQVWDPWRTGHLGERKAEGYKHGQRTCRFVEGEAKKAKDYRRQNDGDEFDVIQT